jgi:hypothetical protein
LRAPRRTSHTPNLLLIAFEFVRAAVNFEHTVIDTRAICFAVTQANQAEERKVEPTASLEDSQFRGLLRAQLPDSSYHLAVKR